MSAGRVAAVAAGIGVTALAAAGLSLGSPGAETKLVLDVRIDPATVVTDDRPPGGASPGDTYVYSGSVRRSGEPFGRYEDIDVGVDARIQGVVRSAVLLLPNGTIVIEGAGGNRPAGGWRPGSGDAMAVVGGTGAYAGVRGTVRETEIADSTMRLTLRLGR